MVVAEKCLLTPPPNIQSCIEFEKIFHIVNYYGVTLIIIRTSLIWNIYLYGQRIGNQFTFLNKN